MRWFQAYRRSGRRDLRTKPMPGRPPRLNTAQVVTLGRLFGAGAQQAGYTTDLWTLQGLADPSVFVCGTAIVLERARCYEAVQVAGPV